MKYSNIILFSDLDGTLLNSQSQVSEENKKAIKEFVAEGGRFGVATGRGMKNALRFLEDIPLNYYGIFSNGSILYAMNKDKIIDKVFLKRERIVPFLKEMIEKYPTVGVMVYVEEEGFFVSSKEFTPTKVIEEHYEYEFVDLTKVEDEEWTKTFFFGEPEQLKIIEKEAATLLEKGVIDALYTHVNYYEFLPKNSNKGSMLKKIQQLKGEGDIIYAVGDFYNDVEMIAEADVGIYTSNAPDELKKKVKLISTDCENHAIADVIHRIIKQEDR
jgi:Cof subfamily protein (haloacid dehalogenase superfamily)